MMSGFRSLGTILIAMATASLTGCVALNIPSERIHDPADQGGVFGSWKGGTGRPVGLMADHAGRIGDPTFNLDDYANGDEFFIDDSGHAHAIAEHGDGGHGSAGLGQPGHAFMTTDPGALTVDPFDTTQGEYAATPPEEVPWPRFHPLPTRPIFGNYR